MKIKKKKITRKKKSQLTLSPEGTDCTKSEGLNLAADADTVSDISDLVTYEERNNHV